MFIISFMKRNYKILIPVVLIAGLLLSFNFNNQPNPEKDRTILQVLTYILTEGHYQPKAIDDQFSEGIYKDFIEYLDPSKHYFFQSDIQEFEKSKTKIDNQILANDLTFFYLVYDRYTQRLEESKAYYKEILSKPIDINTPEIYSVDYETKSFPNSKKDMSAAWGKQLKLRYLGTLYDKEMAEEDKYKADSTYQKKDFAALEKESLDKTKENMDELYVRLNELDQDDYYAIFLNILTAQFEPHTSYFDPKVKKLFDISMSGKLEGIGARLQKDGEYTKVFELISGGPAWRSGALEVGDLILKVAQGDGEPLDIVGMRLDDAIEFIKGKKGTEVRLTLKKVDGTIQTISLIRDIVEIEETFVKSSIILKDGQKYGLINLPKFYFDMDGQNFHNSTTDMEKELERLKNEDVVGIMVDLRDNGGGSLKTAIEISGLFIDRGPMVQVKFRGERPQIKEDDKVGTLWNGPLVILVNELSASASEIFAAAMQDYNRAVIIGSKQTYGKGTVQNFYELNDYANYKEDLGSVKMTIQKFYRINGGSTQLKGVVPDIIVPTRYSYLDIAERDEKYPMEWDKIAPAMYVKWNGYENFDQVVTEGKERVKKDPNFQLIDQNALWLSENQKENNIPLSYKAYKADIQKNIDEAKKFDPINDYKSGLEFYSAAYEKVLITKDTLLAKKREIWHKELNQDVYVEEGVKVLQALKIKASISLAKK